MILAEVAQAHDGSLGLAHAYIDAIAKVGADAVKFQTHIAEAESTPDEPWRVKFSYQDASRFDYWKRMEFTPEQWYGLRTHAKDRGLAFIASPFSVAAVSLLERLEVDAIKVASGEVTHRPMLEAIRATRRPVILSTGMSTWAEIDEAVTPFKRSGTSLTLLQCTSSYPTPPEKVGLNLMQALRARYGCPVGLSDHSGTIYPGLAAVLFSAALVEVHVTMSREMFGPDVSSSITTSELAQLVEGAKFYRAMVPVDKEQIAGELETMREVFGRKWERRAAIA